MYLTLITVWTQPVPLVAGIQISCFPSVHYVFHIPHWKRETTSNKTKILLPSLHTFPHTSLRNVKLPLIKQVSCFPSVYTFPHTSLKNVKLPLKKKVSPQYILFHTPHSNMKLPLTKQVSCFPFVYTFPHTSLKNMKLPLMKQRWIRQFPLCKHFPSTHNSKLCPSSLASHTPGAIYITHGREMIGNSCRDKNVCPMSDPHQATSSFLLLAIHLTYIWLI